jgi:hypothetical protein
VGKLEKRQAGAASASVLGVILLISAALLTVAERGGPLTLLVGGLGGCILVAGVVANARVANEIMQDGRR